MRATNLHPEFGYFCPTPSLRRMVKVALAFTVIGALAGAGGMAALIADHDFSIDGVAMAARAETHSSDQPGASAPAMVKAEVRPAGAAPADTGRSAAKTERIKLDTGKSDVAKSEAAKSEAAKSEAAKSETGPVRAKVEATKVDIAAMEAIKAGAPTADTSKSDAAKVNAAATACEGNACCEGNTWASLDGTCGSSQVRKMRIVRVPTANRASAASASASAPVAAAASASSSQSKPTQGVVASAARTQEPAQQVVAAAKKLQKVAGQTRRRDQAASHVPPPRPEVVSPFGGFFGMLR